MLILLLFSENEINFQARPGKSWLEIQIQSRKRMILDRLIKSPLKPSNDSKQHQKGEPRKSLIMQNVARNRERQFVGQFAIRIHASDETTTNQIKDFQIFCL